MNSRSCVRFSHDWDNFMICGWIDVLTMNALLKYLRIRWVYKAYKPFENAEEHCLLVM